MPNKEEIENMKLKISYAVLFVLICSFYAFGQKSPVMSKKRKKVVTREVINPCSNIATVTDRMTDETKQFSRTVVQSKGKDGHIIIGVAKATNLKDYSTSFFDILVLDNSPSPICLPRRGEVIILFEDGTKVTKSTFNGNCKGELILYLDKSLMEKLKLTKVSAMRVYTGSDSYVEVDFDPTESKQLFNNVACVYQ